MKKNTDNGFIVNDALLACLFGTPDRRDTMERLRQACTLFPDKDLRDRAFILKERIAAMDDFSWTALCKMARWEIGNLFESERFLWDDDGGLDADDEDEDEDTDPEDLDPFRIIPVEDLDGDFE